MDTQALKHMHANDAVLSGSETGTSTLKHPIVTGWRVRVFLARVWWSLLRVALSRYPPVQAIQAVRALYRETRRSWAATGGGWPPKLVRGGGRYFFHLNYPGFPSPAFDRLAVRELDRAASSSAPGNQLQTLILAITRRCPLACQHCSEWKTLNNGPERLSRDDLLAIASHFEARGVTQVLLSGGEPMVRFDDVLALCRAAHPGTDYWIATSGHRLNAAAAARLVAAGLTGVCISLDHFEAEKHDAFRGRPGSFRQAQLAARNAREAGLVVCLSLCATREFVSRDNLDRYAALATELGAGFIQILEPRAVGRYEGQDVALSADQIALLEDFNLSLNTDPGQTHFPAIVYRGYYQRRLGCYGAGRRFIFVNSAGDVQACPFCSSSAGNCLDNSIEHMMEKVERSGCPAYPAATTGNGR